MAELREERITQVLIILCNGAQLGRGAAWQWGRRYAGGSEALTARARREQREPRADRRGPRIHVQPNDDDDDEEEEDEAQPWQWHGHTDKWGDV